MSQLNCHQRTVEDLFICHKKCSRYCPDCPFGPGLCQTVKRQCHDEWHSTKFATNCSSWFSTKKQRLLLHWRLQPLGKHVGRPAGSGSILKNGPAAISFWWRHQMTSCPMMSHMTSMAWVYKPKWPHRDDECFTVLPGSTFTIKLAIVHSNRKCA